MKRKNSNILALYKRIAMALVLLLYVFAASAADYGKYTNLIHEVSRLSSEDIIRRGDTSLAAGKSDEAMVLYMVVCSRSEGKLTTEGRAACVSAHLKAGDIY